MQSSKITRQLLIVPPCRIRGGYLFLSASYKLHQSSRSPKPHSWSSDQPSGASFPVTEGYDWFLLIQRLFWTSTAPRGTLRGKSSNTHAKTIRNLRSLKMCSINPTVKPWKNRLGSKLERMWKHSILLKTWKDISPEGGKKATSTLLMISAQRKWRSGGGRQKWRRMCLMSWGSILFMNIRLAKTFLFVFAGTGQGMIKIGPWGQKCWLFLGWLGQNYSIMWEFMTSMGRIRHRNDTGLRRVNQRRVAKAIRRAVAMGLIPSVHKHPEMLEADASQRRYNNFKRTNGQD